MSNNEPKKTPPPMTTEDALKAEEADQKARISRPRGHYSNSIINSRAGGYHQFANDIGGCGDNYR